MRRATAAAFLLALTTAWNGGNVGAIVAPLAEEFSVSLGEVGLVSGTFFFAGVVAAGLAGSELARRLPIALGLRAACALCLAGNVVCALSSEFAPLVAGRVVSGLGLGLVLLFGGAYARAVGGVRALGVYGAGVTLGVAAALGLGGCWRTSGPTGASPSGSRRRWRSCRCRCCRRRCRAPRPARSRGGACSPKRSATSPSGGSSC